MVDGDIIEEAAEKIGREKDALDKNGTERRQYLNKMNEERARNEERKLEKREKIMIEKIEIVGKRVKLYYNNKHIQEQLTQLKGEIRKKTERETQRTLDRSSISHFKTVPQFKTSSKKEKDKEEYPGLPEKRDMEGFGSPKKTLRNIKRGEETDKIETHNKFELLKNSKTIEEDMDTEPTEEHSTEMSNAINKTQGKRAFPVIRDISKKVPLIVVQGRSFYQAIMTAMKTATKQQLIKEHKANTKMIFAKTMDDFRAVKGVLDKVKYEYHSYTLKENKTHAFILKGLDQTPEADDVMESLEHEHNIQASQMSTKRTLESPPTSGDQPLKRPPVPIKEARSSKQNKSQMDFINYCKTQLETTDSLDEFDASAIAWARKLKRMALRRHAYQ
ncbi:hypothetical protein JTB14_034620 [Gonioctena quinquepunctata]|nr:hypothetical protein JTB14_034620 [Gonioctena quinquepunctata]